MTTFLFWNLNRKSLSERVARLAAGHGVDVVILAECLVGPSEMVAALRQLTGREYAVPFSACERITIYSGYPMGYLQTVADADRFTLRSLTLPGASEILLVAAHLPSKLHWSPESQRDECTRLADEIRRVEHARGHTNTVLIGDLNMNPFEPGVVSARGLHGVMARNIAMQSTRTVQGVAYPFFYNPMWSRLGDESVGPSGTYHDSRAEHVNFFWHTFDQVLIRPDLLPVFRNEDLKVLTHDGTEPLISAGGVPDAKLVSDHLPICFKLYL